MKFIQKVEQFNNAEVENISNFFSISKIVSKILVSRSINSIESANKFLNSTINDLYNPYLFTNMEKVVKRIEQAIVKNEKIVLFGDYDVDGISATAILYKFLIKKGARVQFFLPSRYIEGYGLSEQTINRVFELHSPQLIITVDCGITAIEEVKLIKKRGCDIIITDHHEPQEILPDCLIIDAKVKGETYPFKELCGTGVALKLIQAFVSVEELEEYMPICAIATASDVVELVDENRIIVKEGFKLFEKYLPLGLREFLNNQKLNTNISANDFIFKITPKLNAAGRLGDAYEALKLFISDDPVKISKAIFNLVKMNEKRKELCDKAMQECEDLIQKDKQFKQKKAIILKSENWDSGMLGIVCARLLDEYGKPVILFSKEENKLVGSMRSVKGIDVVEVFKNAKICLEKFGGHSMAGGLTLLPENYEIFKEQVETYLKKIYNENCYTCEKFYDAEITEQELTLKTVQDLKKLAPFGYGNEKPIFKVALNDTKVFSMSKFPQHLLIKFNKNGSCVFFDGQKFKDYFSYFNKSEALIILDENNYSATKNIKCIVKDVVFKDIKSLKKNVMQGYFIYNFIINKNQNHMGNVQQLNHNILSELLQNKLGTVFITYTNTKINDVCESYGCVLNKRSDNQLIYGLKNFDNIKYFDSVVFLDDVPNLNTLHYISKEYDCKVYYKNIKNYNYHSLKILRDNMIEIYKYLRCIISEEKTFINNEEIYKYLQYKFFGFKKYTFLEFLIAINTFIEINIIDKKFVNDTMFYLINGNVDKTELLNSKIYSQFLTLKEIK